MKQGLDNSVSTAVGGSNDDDPSLAWYRRTHYTVRRTDPKLRAPQHDADWWRAPQARKGIIDRLLGLFKRQA